MMLFQSFLLAHTLAVMKLKSEASKLYLSYLWWIIEPLLFVAVFYVVFEVLLGRGGENFIVFLMCGKIPFLWLSKTVNSGANSLVQGKNLMGQRNFPKQVFPFAQVQENLYKQWVVFAILLLILMGFEFMPTMSWWLLPLLIFVNYLLIVLITLVAAILVAYIPDMRMIVSMGTVFLMFSSGIFWDVRDIASIETQNLLLSINPLAFLIDAYRQILMYGNTPDMQHLLIIALVSSIGLVAMYKLYDLQSFKIARRLLS